MMFTWTLHAQVDTIITVTGELGNSEGSLEFLDETGRLAQFPRLTDAGELLYYPPVVTTDSVTNITHSSAIVYGNILFNGWCKDVLEQGFQISTTADFSESVTSHQVTSSYADCEPPCLGNAFSYTFTELMYLTTYYVRAYATNEKGTTYGNVIQFPTPFGCGINTVQDYDGNTYNTVQIGSQCWTRENLKSTHYANGTTIPLGSTSSTTIAYRYNPNNDAANVAIYGYLYNWTAVMNSAASSNTIPSGVQGICPTGWHVPSDREWQIMEFAVGVSESDTADTSTGTTGYRGNVVAKLCSDAGWIFSFVPNTPGDTSAILRNSTGFSAIPAGRYTVSYSYYGESVCFWSATESSSSGAHHHWMNYNRVGIGRSMGAGKHDSYSVRCVHDIPVPMGILPFVTTINITDIHSTSATCGGNVVYEGSSDVTARGVCWSTLHNPTIEDSKTVDGTGTGSFASNLTGLQASTTYYVRAYATNSEGTVYGDEVTFTTSTFSYEEWNGTGRNPNDTKPCKDVMTVKDYDNNTYNTVIIGNQCWMKENLRTTRYDNGVSIPKKTSVYQQKFYFIPNNADSNGFLYNSYAATNTSSWSSVTEKIQGVCPSGWHLPTYNEFREMFNYLSNNGLQCDESIASSVGKAIAASSAEWLSSTNACAIGNNFSANNSSQFSAYPAGWYNYNSSGSESYQTNAYFWMSGNKLTQALRLSYDSPGYGLNGFAENVAAGTGCSVRCLRDYTLPSVSTSSIGDISSTGATGGGVVTDDGNSAVTARGVCWSTLHNPTIEDSKTVDGTGTGGFASNLTGLQASKTYYVRAYATNSEGTAYGEEISLTTNWDGTGRNPDDAKPCKEAATVTDVDGNVYNTVKIGHQCWMKENLRTTKYADGTSISGNATNTSNDYWYYPDNSSSNKTTYGLLYSWKAVMRNTSSSNANPSGVHGICPTGWHVPSNAEWTQLINYVGLQSQYQCNSSSTNIAKALASSAGWTSRSCICCVGNTQSTNNTTAFSAVPAGNTKRTDHGVTFGGHTFYGTMCAYFHERATFWSSTQIDGNTSYALYMYYFDEDFSRTNMDKQYHSSVRCLRD